jgi:hypothetical protein
VLLMVVGSPSWRSVDIHPSGSVVTPPSGSVVTPPSGSVDTPSSGCVDTSHIGIVVTPPSGSVDTPAKQSGCQPDTDDRFIIFVKTASASSKTKYLYVRSSDTLESVLQQLSVRTSCVCVVLLWLVSYCIPFLRSSILFSH